MSWHVLALSARSGEIVWIFQTPDPEQYARVPRIESYPAVNDKHIFFGAPNGMIYALDKRTGETIWQTYIRDYVASSPTISGNYLYILGCDGRFYALDIRTGEICWSYYSRVQDDNHDWLSSSPTISDGNIYIGWDKMYAFSELSIDIDNTIQLFSSNEPSNRVTAVELAIRSGDYHFVEPLIKLLKDKDTEIQKKVLEGLVQFNDDRSFGPIMECLFDMNPDNRGREFVDVNIAHLESPDRIQRIASVNILRSLRNQKAVVPLRSALLVEKDQVVRRLIAHALMELDVNE